VRATGLQIVVVVMGVALLGLVYLIATNDRSVVAYQRTPEGVTVQVPLECAGIAEGGGLVASGEPREVDAPEGVPVLDAGDDLTEACPSEGPVWLGVMALLAVLVVGGTVWAVLWLGRPRPSTA
jgi:hypothetical protein